MTAPKFIFQFSVRNDVPGCPNQIYGLEQSSPFEEPRDVSMHMMSSMVPHTMEEMAEHFEKDARALRHLADKDHAAELGATLVPGNDSVN